MKERTCNHCGETVYLAERGDRIEGPGETPLEHMERTGHAYNESTPYKCLGCGNVWGYAGSADRPTCSFCRGKRTEPINQE